MKNRCIRSFFVFVVAMVFGIAAVNAMTESQLLEKLTGQFYVNGVVFEATDSQKELIATYLDQYEVSSADCDYIAAQVDAVFDVLRNSGKTSFYDLSAAEKSQIVSLVADVSANTSVDVAIVSGELVVYVPGTNKGEVFYKTPVNPDVNGEIAQTNRTVVIAGLGIFSLIGMAFAFGKIRNA